MIKHKYRFFSIVSIFALLLPLSVRVILDGVAYLPKRHGGTIVITGDAARDFGWIALGFGVGGVVWLTKLMAQYFVYKLRPINFVFSLGLYFMFSHGAIFNDYKYCYLTGALFFVFVYFLFEPVDGSVTKMGN